MFKFMLYGASRLIFETSNLNKINSLKLVMNLGELVQRIRTKYSIETLIPMKNLGIME